MRIIVQDFVSANNATWIFTVIAFGLIAIVSVQDIRSKKVSFRMLSLVASVSIMFTLYKIAVEGAISWNEILLSLIPGAVMILVSILTRESLGYGDGLLIFCLGPLFGLQFIISGLIIAFFLSGLFSLVILALKRKRNITIAFVPFIGVGMGVIAFAGL